MLFGAKKRLIWRFLKISILLDFVTNLILKTPKNVLENTNKEASQKIAIPMKNFSKIMNRRNVQKNYLFFCLTVLLEGGDKFEAFHWCFVTKLNTPKPSPFCGKLKIFSEFLFHFRAFRHFFEKFNTFLVSNGISIYLKTYKRASQLCFKFS